jgi:hypothetical protein
MSLRHLRGLVERGRWLAAVEYLDRYLPPPTIRRSYHAQVLRNFLVTHHRFADAVDGIVDKTLPRHYLQLNNGRAISHADLRLQSIAFSILLTVDELRYVISVSARARPTLDSCGVINVCTNGTQGQHELGEGAGKGMDCCQQVGSFYSRAARLHRAAGHQH